MTESLSPPAPARANTRLNLTLALIMVAVLIVMRLVTGEIPVNNGHGWDGGDYAKAIEDGVHTASANIALRPLVIWANTPLFRVLGSAVSAFRWMNDLYIGLLGLAICLLFDRYSNDRRVKVLLILNLSLCVATMKCIAYYPVLVDAGAYAVLMLAMTAIAADRRRLIVPATMAAVLAREFCAAAVVFGVVRDLRRRVPLVTIALTYVPTLAVFLLWRRQVSRLAGDAGASMWTASRLLENLRFWQEPVFVTFFFYFVGTVFGGISLFALSCGRSTARHWRREPEWALFVAMIVGVTAVGDADIWRYLAYCLPAAVVAFAVGMDALSPRRRVAAGVVVSLATLITQRPWQAMTVPLYFRDWFPYYLQKGGVPLDEPVDLWPTWAWRLFATLALFLALGFVAQTTLPAPLSGRTSPDGAPRGAAS